jgi:hypothetical protein
VQPLEWEEELIPAFGFKAGSIVTNEVNEASRAPISLRNRQSSKLDAGVRMMGGIFPRVTYQVIEHYAHEARVGRHLGDGPDGEKPLAEIAISRYEMQG